MRQWVRPLVWATLFVLAMFALVLLWYRYLMLPRGTRRAVVEGVLSVILVGYATILTAALVTTVSCGWIFRRAWKRRESKPLAARLTLLGVSCLLSLGFAEVTATLALTWIHRMPVLPVRFDPPDGREHIVVLGGSTAMGHPYAPTVSLGKTVAMELEDASPGRKFPVDILAFLGGSIQDMHLKLVNLQQRPAAMIIESGHNEFPSRFEEERNVELDEAPGNRVLLTLYHISLNSSLCRLIYDQLSKNRLDGAPSMMSKHELIDAPMFTPSEAIDVLENFERRLEAIVSYCDRIDALPILVVEPGLEAEYPPNRSLLPASVGEPERKWVQQQYQAARAASPGQAIELYREIIRRHPGFAESHYQLACLLEQQGKYDDARDHYLLARDLDGMTFRCTTTFQDVVKRVARRHPRAILIDGPRELRAICPHGIIDHHAMQDAVHPNVRGITATARAILRELRARKALGYQNGDPERLEPATVAERSGMGSAEWRIVCNWGRSFYRWVALFRFDPTEHNRTFQQFDDCEKAIAAGKPPHPNPFPALSLEPLHPRSSHDLPLP